MEREMAMFCSKKQFKKLKPKLIALGCRIVDIRDSWETYTIIINHYLRAQNCITNVSWNNYSSISPIEKFNEQVFLEACGYKEDEVLVETTKPTTSNNDLTIEEYKKLVLKQSKIITKLLAKK